METNKKIKTIGILGGMGPEATMELFKMIIRMTEAEKDQDHLPIFIDNCPQIPDRTNALLYGGESPLLYLYDGLKKLELVGADFILVPCNTAHAFLPSLEKHASVPIINMVESTMQHIKSYNPNIKKIGLMATTGTIKTGIYNKYASNMGFEIIAPDSNTQENEVMKIIYDKEGVKAGFNNAKLRNRLFYVCDELKQKGAEALVLGCTELSVLLPNSTYEIPIFDPLKILAQKAVEIAKGREFCKEHIGTVNKVVANTQL
jgi:aspartate racemase